MNSLRVLSIHAALVVLGGTLLMGASSGCELAVAPSPQLFPPKVMWTPDGKHIIFSRGFQGVFIVDVAGSELRAILEGAPLGTAAAPSYALPALSPDGTRLALVAPLGMQRAAIMVSALDGSGMRRLTQDEGFNTHPAWSPDGEEIAYIADGRLTVMRADGTSARVLAPSVAAVGAAPVWSPDGSRIAFVGEPQDTEHRVVYTVQPNRTGLTKLGATASVPSWSPDGSRLAFLIPEDKGEVSLYTLANDGAELLRAWRLENPIVWADNLSWSPDGYEILFAFANGEVVVVRLDESEYSGPSQFSQENTPIGYKKLSAPQSHLPPPKREHPVEDAGIAISRGEGEGRWAAWSPVLGRVAVILDHNSNSNGEADRQDVLYTMSRAAFRKRVLVQGNEKLLEEKHADWYNAVRNVAVCAEAYAVSDPTAKGFVVPAPYVNPGLAGDCQTLMTIRDTLAGDLLLNWSRETPITDWWGVVLHWREQSYVVGSLNLIGSGDFSDWRNASYFLWSAGREAKHDPTYQGFDLGHPGLTGSIPAELAKLTNLSSLTIVNNRLAGAIPSELGNLTYLHTLNLGNNGLTGSIPPELGNLKRLSGLFLESNSLSGNIPPELGSLPELDIVFLFQNSLTGCVPAALIQGVNKLETDDGLDSCE